MMAATAATNVERIWLDIRHYGMIEHAGRRNRQQVERRQVHRSVEMPCERRRADIEADDFPTDDIDRTRLRQDRNEPRGSGDRCRITKQVRPHGKVRATAGTYQK